MNALASRFGRADRYRLLIRLATALCILMLVVPVSHAAFPGTNGKIAFQSYRNGNSEIYVMNSDGTNQVNVSNHSANDYVPSWSPDGTKIAFATDRDGNIQVYVMNADGSGQTNLTNSPSNDNVPSWSPDGSKILFTSDRDGNQEIYVMNANGSGQTRLTNDSAYDNTAVWSPNGSKIAFSSNRSGNNEIHLMNPDGTGVINLTNNASNDVLPSWSPDGIKIAFYTDRPGNWEVYAMNADGTAQTNLSGYASAMDIYPAWSPDGTKILFQTNRDGNDEVYVMNTDGTGQINLSNNSGTDGWPSWQPIVIVTVAIDIKPSSHPNSINLRSKGVVPVAVLTTNVFNASAINPSTVKFAGAMPVRWTMEDVNGDSRPDMLFHFETEALNLTSASTMATLTGKTWSGQSITGADTVNIVPK